MGRSLGRSDATPDGRRGAPSGARVPRPRATPSRDYRTGRRAPSFAAVKQPRLEVAIVASIRDGELLGELEEESAFETEGLYEDEIEGEGIFGAIGNALSGLLGEGEDEFGAHELHELAHEIEGAGEDELAHELEGEGEDELAHELEGEFGAMGELEAGEAFFGRLIRRALPVLRQVAKVAAPAIGTAFGGPLGGRIAGMLASNLEGEMEDEASFEMHELHETEMEVHEAAGEYEAHAEAEITESEAQAELMAAAAAGAESEAEAEAMIGAATLAALTARERRDLRRALPHLVRATAILTRLLRRRRITRPMVRTVPSIVHHTARTLVDERNRTGRPITRRRAARVMTVHTRRHLCSPRYGGMALQRNVRATRRLQRVAQVPMRRTAVVAAPRRRVRY
jgi:hypothetical protein